ncbi:MAG: rubredoxin [bacterium]|nr:rubredoxin [bacterium]
MKQWKCLTCGYIHIGVEPPDFCPRCGVSKNLFVEMSETSIPK